MPTTLTADGIIFPDDTVQYTVSHTKYRNRIINSRMQFDQRNDGALVTYQKTGFPTGKTNGYFVDRFELINIRTNGSTMTAQQVIDAPANINLTYSAKITNTLGGVTAPSDVILLLQRIEGINIADLGWGGLSARFVTLSFWVKSSIIGIFSVALVNGPGNRSILKEYTINSANTWEKKSIVITGSADGIWDTGTGIGVYVVWDLGCGSTRTAPATDTWLVGNYDRSASSVRLSETTGATFQLTGVQFEEGINPTDLEYLPPTIELLRCERYFSVNYSNFRSYTVAGGIIECWLKWRRPLRLPNPIVAPTVYRTAGTVSNIGNLRILNANQYGARFELSVAAAGYAHEYNGIYKVEAEI